LKDINNIRHDRRLSIGAVLAIPLQRDVADSKVPFNYSPEVKGINFGSVKSYIARNDVSKTKLRSAKRELSKPKGKEKLVYIVKRGDTLGHIAEWYGVRASDIRNWNDIEYGSYIHAGQKIAVWVPVSKSKLLKKVNTMEFSEKQAMTNGEITEAIHTEEGKTRTASSSTEWIQHTVKYGESLEKIARTYEVSVNDLKRWNNLRNSRINAGQTLDIYDKPEERVKLIAAPVEVNSAPSVKTSGTGIFSATHKVKKGESIYVIAKKYEVGVKELKDYNKLHSDKIFAGQVLKIPPKL
jgi:LysM repeat protein